MTDEVAGVYCRLSLARMKDPMGKPVIDQAKVDEQERVSRLIALSRSWPVATGIGYPEPNGAYVDNNRSAWQKDRHRPGWDAMLADVNAGKLSRLVIYHGDRLVRQPYDLELLLNLADQRGIIIASGSGDYRLDVPADRFVLRILTAKACLESDDLSRRKKAGFVRMHQAGLAPAAGGRYGRGFGYDSLGREPVPAEADAIREAADRVLGGETLTAISADLARRGILATSGGPLNYQSLKRILIRPRIAGLLADTVTTGNWEPIIDRVTWEMVCAALGGRTLHHGGSAKYMLSGLATCWACGRPVQVQQSASVKGYGCVTPGCRKVHRNMELLDAYVAAAVVKRLNDPRNPAGRAPGNPGMAAQIVALTAQQAELAALVADPDQPHLNLLLARLGGVEDRLARLREHAGDAARLRIVSAHRGLTLDGWAVLPLAVRRGLVSALFEVTVLRASRRGPGFRDEDIRLTPR